MIKSVPKLIKYFLLTGLYFFLSASVVLASSVTNKATKTTANKDNGFSAVSSLWTDLKTAPFLSAENILRFSRILSLIFAILFINVVLIGAFRYIVTSNDDKVAKSRREIVIGLVGVLLTFCVYFWISAILVKMKVVL